MKSRRDRRGTGLGHWFSLLPVAAIVSCDQKPEITTLVMLHVLYLITGLVLCIGGFEKLTWQCLMKYYSSADLSAAHLTVTVK